MTLRRPSWVAWLLAVVLAGILLGLALRAHSAGTAAGYDRALFMPHGWPTVGESCRTVRELVLARDSVIPVDWDAKGCHVRRGWWRDAYDRAKITDPAALDIDHVVPLEWAWQHGADRWTPEQREAFATEYRFRWALRVTSRHWNRQKGSHGLEGWLPPGAGDEELCDYGLGWAGMLAWYGLEVPASTRTLLGTLLQRCGP